MVSHLDLEFHNIWRYLSTKTSTGFIMFKFQNLFWKKVFEISSCTDIVTHRWTHRHSVESSIHHDFFFRWWIIIKPRFNYSCSRAQCFLSYRSAYKYISPGFKILPESSKTFCSSMMWLLSNVFTAWIGLNKIHIIIFISHKLIIKCILNNYIINIMFLIEYVFFVSLCTHQIL